MADGATDTETPSRAPRPTLLLATCLILPVVIGAALWTTPPLRQLPPAFTAESKFPASRVTFRRESLGGRPQLPPRMTNVQIVDLDRDGKTDVLVCDGRRNAVLQYRQTDDPDDPWTEIVLADDILAPAHATPDDLDGDGDIDVLVSVLGNLSPDDRVIGGVVLLENVDGRYESRVLLDDVRRVADTQVADLDDDGDRDLVVAVFGYARGEVLWLENNGDMQFTDHQLLYAPGTIHVPLADYDGDGDIDIAAIVSQDEEELWAIENVGPGEFRPRRLWATANFDIGSAGLIKVDLDSDGDSDLLLPTGDNLEYPHTYPQPYHGCLWFENTGDWEFKPHWIARFGGTYAAEAGDIDGDSDQDVVLVSLFNDWRVPGSASIVWLENDGEQNFTTWQITDDPIRLATVACGDINGDGRDDLVSGGLHLMPPFERLGRVDVWYSGDESD